jgi:Flp pilus assembly protein TadG
MMSIRNRQTGQSLVEFALLVPLMFLFVVNVVNFGGFFFAWITVANAARAGAQYAILGGASVMSPTPPTAAQITAVITQDISSLRNRGSLVVQVCSNNNGTITPNTCPGTVPLDPEPATYVLTTIDVTYTYQPFIPLWNFSALGIRATLPPTTVHRQAVMRMIQ